MTPRSSFIAGSDNTPIHSSSVNPAHLSYVIATTETRTKNVNNGVDCRRFVDNPGRNLVDYTLKRSPFQPVWMRGLILIIHYYLYASDLFHFH